MWHYNDLDAGYQQARVTAMVMKRAHAIVGANPDELDRRFPLVTIESPQEVVAAINRWTGTALDETIRYFTTLYLPEYGHLRDRRRGLVEVNRDDHQLGEVPVVPIVNRPARCRGRRGG